MTSPIVRASGIVFFSWSVVTPIHTVLTAKTGHLDLYTKEGVELLCFRILLGQRTKCACSQQSSADFQHSETDKSHFAVWSSSKSDGQNFLTLVLAVNMSDPWLAKGASEWAQEGSRQISNSTNGQEFFEVTGLTTCIGYSTAASSLWEILHRGAVERLI